MGDESLLYGRELVRRDIETLYTSEEKREWKVRPAFLIDRGQYRCNRCLEISTLEQPYPCLCGKKCYYCRECIQLGKVRECDELVSMDEPNRFSTFEHPYLKWGGTLSQQQYDASMDINESIVRNEKRIIWAVTGAGKTEMLFYGIGQALEQGKRVCIASPRIDVCLELAPRIQTVFPEIDSVLLYGGSEDVYRYTQLVVTTTHQLFRFKEAFDVIVIDEIDAFPYYLNHALNHAAEKARKKRSCVIYLTATPDKRMQTRIKKGEIHSSILPARYHKHSLPVPKGYFLKATVLKASFNRSVVYFHVKRLLEQKKKFLLFVPTISLMEAFVPILEEHIGTDCFKWVHSKDPLRKEKVMEMRNGKLDFLLTTTILERGVTFENIDVIVLLADHDIYTEAALVQISGRAGRSFRYPDGEVTFYHQGWTRSIKGAIRQIRHMNKLAKEKGLID